MDYFAAEMYDRDVGSGWSYANQRRVNKAAAVNALIQCSHLKGAEQKKAATLLLFPNSVPPLPRHFAPNDVVITCGLNSRDDLNGKKAMLLRFNPTSSRWEARFHSSWEIMSIKSTNLSAYAPSYASSGNDEKPELPLWQQSVAKYPHATKALVVKALSRYSLNPKDKQLEAASTLLSEDPEFIFAQLSESNKQHAQRVKSEHDAYSNLYPSSLPPPFSSCRNDKKRIEDDMERTASRMTRELAAEAAARRFQQPGPDKREGGASRGWGRASRGRAGGGRSHEMTRCHDPPLCLSQETTPNY
ncbi:hypothetical protein TrST_g4515 [Triparma strigata]|uniref:Uncharacterized protein n=1 Tax=Triparma strigata TaxID=1606541 RepID=A0A9W6ZPG5_9STRA|nr:hypothetical protein TrST_g4515 [Triparma strigata]